MKKRSFGTHAAAEICQVTPPTIVRWMEEGHLPFFATLGGHRRVWDKDLAAFLEARNMPVPEELKSPQRTKQILIVDDEDQVRRVVKRTLQKFHSEFEVHEAADGYEAGHKMALLAPSLVILDIKLPGLDGYHVCKMIRSDPRLKSAKILAISGQDADESKERSLAAGADDFLAKPFDAEQLKQKVAGMLQ